MDQYTSDFAKWGLVKYVNIFDGAHIDILAMQMLGDREIEELIGPIGDRLKFKCNLALWKEENSKSKDVREEEPNYDEFINTETIIGNLLDLDLPLNYPASTSTPSTSIQKLQIDDVADNSVRGILKKTHEGRAILAQENRLLTPELRRKLSNLVIKKLFDENPKTTISNPTFMR